MTKIYYKSFKTIVTDNIEIQSQEETLKNFNKYFIKISKKLPHSIKGNEIATLQHCKNYAE